MKITLTLAALLLSGSSSVLAQSSTTVREVAFKSTDGKTIKGYLFQPAGGGTAKHPAMVILGGRRGIYSSQAGGVYNASTIARRYKAWEEFWVKRNFEVLIVDDFGSFGYPTGFASGTYGERPAVLDDVHARPAYAIGGLAYLRARPDVDRTKILYMGGSNGGSAGLATLAATPGGNISDTHKVGFRAGVIMYPGCGLQGQFQKTGYIPYSPVQVYMGTADQEVSPLTCKALVARSRSLGGSINITLYDGAEHDFDDPGKQQVAANAAAKAKAEQAIEAFVAAQIK